MDQKRGAMKPVTRGFACLLFVFSISGCGSDALVGSDSDCLGLVNPSCPSRKQPLFSGCEEGPELLVAWETRLDEALQDLDCGEQLCVPTAPYRSTIWSYDDYFEVTPTGNLALLTHLVHPDDLLRTRPESDGLWLLIADVHGQILTSEKLVYHTRKGDEIPRVHAGLSSDRTGNVYVGYTRQWDVAVDMERDPYLSMSEKDPYLYLGKYDENGQKVGSEVTLDVSDLTGPRFPFDTGLTAGTDGELFVWGNNRLQRYDSTGDPLWPEPAHFDLKYDGEFIGPGPFSLVLGDPPEYGCLMNVVSDSRGFPTVNYWLWGPDWHYRGISVLIQLDPFGEEQWRTEVQVGGNSLILTPSGEQTPRIQPLESGWPRVVLDFQQGTPRPRKWLEMGGWLHSDETDSLWVTAQYAEDEHSDSFVAVTTLDSSGDILWAKDLRYRGDMPMHEMMALHVGRDGQFTLVLPRYLLDSSENVSAAGLSDPIADEVCYQAGPDRMPCEHRRQSDRELEMADIRIGPDGNLYFVGSRDTRDDIVFGRMEK